MGALSRPGWVRSRGAVALPGAAASGAIPDGIPCTHAGSGPPDLGVPIFLGSRTGVYHHGYMPIGAPKDITACRRFFQAPRAATHRAYEALRAYFLEGRPSHAVARAFGYTAGALRGVW